MKVVVVPKFTSASLDVGRQGYHSGRAPPLQRSPCTLLKSLSVNESEKGGPGGTHFQRRREEKYPPKVDLGIYASKVPL